ncbi:hypothetical protein PHYBOEH_004733 [Phytophthora boehmeriae]|uniref:Uncharacterized protein n=1 Tax=Phytophthora boehmeriae TaxID=109152 RepID=A0A8T1X4I9_9STRA|nr:hypothetical protein PHYBOEH_004733 [Phytophthora boehmeriae]
MPVPETRDESIKVDPEASGDGEFPVAAESGFTVDEDESAVHLIAEGIVDNVAALEKIAPMDSEENTSEMLPEITANEHQENVVEAEADKSSPSPCAIDPAVDSVVAELCSSVVALQVTRTTHRCSADFTFDSKEETDTCPPELATANRLGQARPSVLLWQAPFETACAKEAVESSAKRRASKRRTSRRVFCDLLAFPTELARTSSDTTLLAYDAQHEQSQPFALLDHNILSINPNGRHIQLDDYDICDGKIIGKRKTLMQELHSKNIALRQIPRFNYLPVRIKFQWSDFVVATPVRPSTSNFEGALLSKSPVEPMRLLQKRGTKLSCGTYVIVSAFIRPLEDGNENLRVQIYDAERVEEFQFDFSEDVMKKYQLESTGLEAQSREFLGHLEFRRDEDTVIIKLPEKKVGEGAKPSSGERFQSERTMVGDGDPRRRLLPTNNYQKRPATSPEGMNTQGSKSLAVEALSQLATDEVESPSVQEQTTAEEFRPR